MTTFPTLEPQSGIEPASARYKGAALPLSYWGVPVSLLGSSFVCVHALAPHGALVTLVLARNDVDAEAGFYLKQPVDAFGRVQVHELPPVTVASAMHHGAYNRLSEAYDALLRWVGSSGYVVAGPIRELYLQISMPVRQDDESYITEIQAPVAKAA